MKCRRLRLRWVIPSVIFLIPPLFWLLILAVTPTEWARTKVVAKLGKATGRTIHLAKLRVGALGGVNLEGLEIGAPGSSNDPWLKVASARINVSAWQMLTGQFEPSEIDVDGLSLRVLRRQDGSLELADLLRPSVTEPSNSDPAACDTASFDIRLNGGMVTILDESSKTRLNLSNVQGQATWHDKHASVPELRGMVNGGTFNITASWDRSIPDCAYDARIQVRDLVLDEGTNSIIYLLPILSGMPKAKSLEGRFGTTVYVRGSGTTREALKRSLVGQGTMMLDPINLDGSRLLEEVADMLELPEEDRVGAVKTDFAIRDAKIRSDNLTIDVAKYPIVLSGWTDFDGNLDYKLRSDIFASRLPSKARELLEEFAIDVAKEVSVFHVTGTLDAMKISVDGPPPDRQAKAGDPQRRNDEREKLRDLGRRFRERILR
ncbi:hypothetical protein [Singulisphaera sp. PoT]|uniref:DUF748 domain-containing protein n=1 Tax=Singulisphaera sp. PoT TaxID=3411797 RepID=UPI003BF55FD3